MPADGLSASFSTSVGSFPPSRDGVPGRAGGRDPGEPRTSWWTGSFQVARRPCPHDGANVVDFWDRRFEFLAEYLDLSVDASGRVAVP